MPCRLKASIVALAVLCLGVPRGAAAQLYSWHDAAGGFVVSNKPPGSVATTFAVTKTEEFRATRPPAPGRKTGAYDDLIEQHAAANSLNVGLVRAVIQAESGFNPFARSNKGAMGLMQLMPATARAYGVSNPYDAAENIRAGAAYLRDLLSRYRNDTSLALAAYNAGPGAVERYGAVPPFKETRDYIARIRSRTGADADAPPVTHIYRTDEIVNGRAVPRYSNRSGSVPERSPR